MKKSGEALVKVRRGKKLVNMLKGILPVFLCFVLLTGCGTGDNWIFSIREQKLNEKEVMAFGFIYTKEYNINDVNLLEKEYEENITYAQYYKKQLEQDIIDSVLLYQEAEQNRFALGEAEEKRIEEAADQLLDYYGDALSKKGIDRKTVEEIYKMRITGEAYLESLLENEKGDERERYIKVYQVTFPTVELDENGMVRSTADGEIMGLPDSEVAAKKEEASDFLAAVKEGGDMEALLKDYDSTVTGIEKYLPYNSLDAAYKNAIDGLSAGGVSQVITADYGYYVVKLLEKDAKEYANTLSEHEEGRQNDKAREDLLNDLYDKYIYGRNEYRNQEQWNAISFEQFMK